MKKGVSEGLFQFHSRCRRVATTHVCFADDVIIFTKGNVDSVKGVVSILGNFSRYSSLSINSSKTSLLTGGVDANAALLWANEMDFQCATPPIKYLGLPLCMSRLSENDCYPLIERITGKIHSWQVRFLSYAGRVELVKSVLSSLCIYWLKAFVLPKSVLGKIKSLCGKFLWECSKVTRKTH